MAKLLPVIVLYNIKLEDCKTYCSLLCDYPGDYVVYENSPVRHNYDKNDLYFYDNTNGGVSAAYNYGYKMAKEKGCFDAILLLDQDTVFQPNYIQVLVKTISQHPDISLFIPQILYNQNVPFSPVKFDFFSEKGVILCEGVYNLKRFIPVNSGACIRLTAFEKVGGYNPHIRLDFADFDFFTRLSDHYPLFYMLNSVALQSFSNNESNINKLYRRYNLYLEGANYAIKNRQIRWIVICSVLKHSVALTIRTGSLQFVRSLLRNLVL